MITTLCLPARPKSQRARRICGAQSVLLLLVLAPGMPALLVTTMAAVTVVLLTYSFGADAWLVLSTRRRASSSRTATVS